MSKEKKENTPTITCKERSQGEIRVHLDMGSTASLQIAMLAHIPVHI